MPIERIQILNEKTGQKFNVMFNPEEYSLNKDNNYAAKAFHVGYARAMLQVALMER